MGFVRFEAVSLVGTGDNPWSAPFAVKDPQPTAFTAEHVERVSQVLQTDQPVCYVSLVNPPSGVSDNLHVLGELGQVLEKIEKAKRA